MGDFEGLTDTHAHLSYLEGRGLERGTVAALFDGGFGFVLDVGTEPGDLGPRIAAFSDRRQVRFACGIWPHAELCTARYEAVARIEADIDAAPPGLVVAIGECGFDRRENPVASREETELFELQLDLARRRGLPVIVHSREAPEETQEVISRYRDVRGVIHCFSYTQKEARAFLDAGWYISFAGNLTYKNAGQLRETLPFIPADRLLLETDCPYLAPVPHRGEVCHPGMVRETFKTAAALLAIDLDRLKERVARNAAALFML